MQTCGAGRYLAVVMQGKGFAESIAFLFNRINILFSGTVVMTVTPVQ